jgi:hypothetical protein
MFFLYDTIIEKNFILKKVYYEKYVFIMYFR